MKMILGRLNGNSLCEITASVAKDTKEVLAAVAYATDATLLFEWCRDEKIPLTFYGRLDDSVPVKVDILESFLNNDFGKKTKCYLVEKHHAKVIWWKGAGVYIGSANLTNLAWNEGIEAGCFFANDAINSEMQTNLKRLFDGLHNKAIPLKHDVLEIIKERNEFIRDEKKGRSARKSRSDFKDKIKHAMPKTEPSPKADDELKPSEKFRKEFWDGFSRHLAGNADSHSRINQFKPSHRSHHVFYLTKNVTIDAAMRTRDEKLVVSLNLVNKTQAKYDVLYQAKDEIEASLGERLVWEWDDKKNIWKPIKLWTSADVNDESKCPEQYAWLLEKLRKFEQVFGPRVKDF